MKLNPRAFGISAGLVAALLFTFCAAGVWLAPYATTALLGMLIHADLTGIIRTLTLGSFAAGLVCWTVGTGFTFGTVAAIDNGMSGSAVPAAG